MPLREGKGLGRSEQDDSAAGLKATGSPVETGGSMGHEGHGCVQITFRVWHCSMGIPGKADP